MSADENVFVMLVRRTKRALQWLSDLMFYGAVATSGMSPLAWIEQAEKHELKKIARGWGPGFGYW
jgi:hypothetical protein